MLIVVLVVVALITVSVPMFKKINKSQTTTQAANELERTHDRLMKALENNDYKSAYLEFAPSIKALFSEESVVVALSKGSNEFGKVVRIETLEKPEIKVGKEWKGNYADGKTRVFYEKGEEDFYIRYVYEEGRWWFLGNPE